MEFLTGEAEALKVPDVEVSILLNDVYVGENFIGAEAAIKLFEAEAVKKRGVTLCTVEK